MTWNTVGVEVQVSRVVLLIANCIAVGLTEVDECISDIEERSEGGRDGGVWNRSSRKDAGGFLVLRSGRCGAGIGECIRLVLLEHETFMMPERFVRGSGGCLALRPFQRRWCRLACSRLEARTGTRQRRA